MRNFILFCFLSFFGQFVCAQKAEFIPQIPHLGKDPIKLFTNIKAGTMLSIEKNVLKYWDLKTRLLIATKEISLQNLNEGAVLSDDGVLCAFQGYLGERLFITRNGFLADDSTLFLTKKLRWIRSKYDSKILIRDVKTNQVVMERNFEYGENVPLNADLSKYIVLRKGKKIQILESETLKTIFTLESSVGKYALFDIQGRFLVLYNKFALEIYDLRNPQPQKIVDLEIASGAENIAISDDFPLLFYSNLQQWGVIDFKENKKLIEKQAKYPEHLIGNGAFVPNQKALFQFRKGQLGVLDITSQHWRPLGTQLSREQGVELNFPRLFLNEVLVSPTKKLQRMQEVFGYEHHKYLTTSFFDNKSYKIYRLTPPSSWSNTKNTEFTIFDAQKKTLEYQTELKMVEGDKNILMEAFENKILVGKQKTSYTDYAYQIIDYQNKNVISSFNSPKGDCFLEQLSKKGKYALFRKIGYPDNMLKIVETKTDKTIFEQTSTANMGIITPDEKYLIYDKKELLSPVSLEIYDIEQKKVIGSISCQNELQEEFIWEAYVDEAENQLILGTKSGKIVVWNLQNHQFVSKIKALESPISQIYTDEKYLYVQNDVEIKIFEKKSRKLHIGLIMKLSEDNEQLQTMVYTEEGYYMVDKNITDFIAFKQNDAMYAFDQFDLQYNRPDKVLERIGLAQKTLIESYRKAYEKRLKKMSFDAKSFEGGNLWNAPAIQLKNQEAHFQEVSQSQFVLELMAKDSLYNLDRLNVYINGVPAFGAQGKNLKTRKSKEYSEKIVLELSQGENTIEVSVLNEKGAESLKERIEVYYEHPQTQRPDLYLITIGVSEYENTKMNLQYATKDGKDLASLLQSQKGVYGSVRHQALFDKEVTKTNVLKLKRLLEKTQIDDVVIIFISGHGLLDKNLNYYMATHPIDFGKPEEKGLAYEDLESILDGIPARQKILLMDACHSGEIDKEEVIATTQNASLKKEGLKFKNFDELSIKNKNVGLQNSFELSRQLFADLRKGSGATVLSAASGVQLAQESSEWQNGAFTYCLLKGLKEMKADLNKDGKIMLSELQKYIFEQVPELTGGLQQPTSRMENLIRDFQIW